MRKPANCEVFTEEWYRAKCGSGECQMRAEPTNAGHYPAWSRAIVACQGSGDELAGFAALMRHRCDGRLKAISKDDNLLGGFCEFVEEKKLSYRAIIGTVDLSFF